MKTLTLLRHAKSSWAEAGLDDHERPLAERGLRDAPMIGARLAAHGIEPGLILSSTAVRARETARLAAAAFAADSGRSADLKLLPEIYLASPGKLLAVLAGVDDAVGALVLVGHNPGMTELVNLMLPSLRLANLPTAGAIVIECDTPSWRDIDAAGFRFLFGEFPKQAHAPRAPGTAQSTSQKQ